MKFKNYLETLTETFSIPTDKPILIILMGGIASGKTTTYKKYFAELPLLDIDLLTNGNQDKRYFWSKVLQNKTEKILSGNNSVVYTKTGAYPEKILINLELAKQKNMKTAVVFVDTNVNQALQNNINRNNDGDWHLIEEKEIISSNKKARKNFKTYQEICDYSYIIKTSI